MAGILDGKGISRSYRKAGEVNNMIPYKPEPIESLRARLPKALEKVWVVEYPMTDRPGLHREHMFDFESGLRLLISKDKLAPQFPVGIHISASWEYNIPEIRSFAELTEIVQEAARLLYPNISLQFIGISGAGIPHWLATPES